jgi:taurine dioxygenase
MPVSSILGAAPLRLRVGKLTKMAPLKVEALHDDLSFGARISGVTREILKDKSARREIRNLFELRGVLVFEGVEADSHLQIALSEVFGPLKDHPLGDVARADADLVPGVIELKHDPATAAIIELNGQRLSEWLPWHFDHCYNNELNRAGVLRATVIPPALGFTRFADGVQLYNDLSPSLRRQIDGKNILYSLDMRFPHMRFGKPPGLIEVTGKKIIYDLLKKIHTLPRAIHPAVWTRKTGEKVLHISPWMALGIEGDETPEGDALLTATCDEMLAKAKIYEHRWKLSDMVVWDNWRLLHSVTGCDPKHARCMQRTTIKGDYGLGRFENGGTGDKILEMTV